MRVERWVKEDLTLKETDNGLLVSQAGRTYRSAKWKLTDQLIDIVNMGLECGLSAQWQSGHPSDAFFEGGLKFEKGIHHISFAPSQSHKWVFVVGHEGVNKPWGEQLIENVTVNKKYRNFVSRSGVGWKWEIHRGKNIFVPTENLSELLSGLTLELISAVESSPRSEIPWKRAITGIDSEKHLEEVLVEFLGEVYSDKIYRLDVRPIYEGRFPDIIIHLNDKKRLVLELKLDKPGEAGLQQIREYLELDSLINSPGGELNGALVCRDFEPGVIHLAQSRNPKISLYKYDYRDNFMLTLVSGEDILGNA